MAVTMLRAWAVFNASRLPGGEWEFDRFCRDSTRLDDDVIEVRLAEGKARVMDDRTVFVDQHGEVTPQPIKVARLQYWIERAAAPVREVA